VFFDDVLRQTSGEHPQSKTQVPAAAPPQPKPDVAVPSSGSAPGWSQLVTATTLEDEVKAIKLEIDRLVTTPGAFASSGHQPTRRQFSLLAVLFAVIEQYDGEVRWQQDAPAARGAFARVARNLRAGGSSQVYQEVKRRQQALDVLIRGGRWTDPPEEETEANELIDRVPLMQLLEQRLESNLKSILAREADFRARGDTVRHEAEITAVLGRVLLRPGMDDAEDAEYEALARLLEQGAVQVAAAAVAQDWEAAGRAMSDISRSCVDCHESYR
jgi:hypothetical protein